LSPICRARTSSNTKAAEPCLSINDLSLRIAGRLLLDHASLTLPAGTKAGLVGRNGTGKTTLFRAITGELASETGSISLPKNTRIGQVAQEAPGTEEPLIEIVLKADKSAPRCWRRPRRRPTRTASPKSTRGSPTSTRTFGGSARGDHSQGPRLRRGGAERADLVDFRAAGACAWRWRRCCSAEPDLLLLDEPTNYLDLEGTLWLEKYLATYPHTVLMISHDRDLLNKAVNSIVHLDQAEADLLRGGYDQFEEPAPRAATSSGTRRARRRCDASICRSFVDRFKAKATKAAQAQSRVKMLAKMKPIAARCSTTRSSPFSFPEPVKKVAAADHRLRKGVSVGYGPASRAQAHDLRIDADDRIALLGANGNGKSTFAKLLAGG
jgi:ATP-binding cassette subfamily F protein 3